MSKYKSSKHTAAHEKQPPQAQKKAKIAKALADVNKAEEAWRNEGNPN